MSQLATGIFGAIAVSLSFGAAQFALGRDLTTGVQNASQNSLQNSLDVSEPAINRAAKADRAAVVAGSQVPTRTISLRFDSLSNTSVLIRVPAVRQADDRSSARPVAKPGKTTLACEPVVSVLTEVAKQLQPGRCVT
jgi:hypothetical protein